MPGPDDPHGGGCLCGAVRYEVTGPLRGIINCYCAMCRHLHGSFGAHSRVKKAHINITGDRGLAWYAPSAQARCGFCAECGSTLFWELAAQDAIGIVAGTLDPPMDLTVIGHIFVHEKADFVIISDSARQFPGPSGGALPDDWLWNKAGTDPNPLTGAHNGRTQKGPLR